MKNKTFKTISDLNLDWSVRNYSFKEFKICLEECNPKINFDKYKIKKGKYLFAVDILKEKVNFKQFQELSDWYGTEIIKINAKNSSLLKFLFELNKKLDKLLEKRADWHIFVEKIRLISSNMFLISLGS